MTKCAQHKVLKFIAWFKLTFDEMVVIHPVGAQEREEVERLREGLADLQRQVLPAGFIFGV